MIVSIPKVRTFSYFVKSINVHYIFYLLIVLSRFTEPGTKADRSGVERLAKPPSLLMPVLRIANRRPATGMIQAIQTFTVVCCDVQYLPFSGYGKCSPEPGMIGIKFWEDTFKNSQYGYLPLTSSLPRVCLKPNILPIARFNF